MPAHDGAAMFPHVRAANGMPDMHLMPGMMILLWDFHHQKRVSILLQCLSTGITHVYAENLTESRIKNRKKLAWQAQMGRKRRRMLT